MKHTILKCIGIFSLLLNTQMPVYAEAHMIFWYENDHYYWYEHGVRQGTYDDENGVIGDGMVRGREIYDPATDAWYWLDACYDGGRAQAKEVWMPYVYQDETPGSTQGKWVRYDKEGKMIKGWYTVGNNYGEYYPNQYGNRYYYDPITGAMAKGTVEIDGQLCYFDENTGVCDDEAWKKAYAKYTAELEQQVKADAITHLMLVDEDFIPELTIDYPVSDGERMKTLLVTWRDGRIEELARFESEADPVNSVGFATGIMRYVEKKNTFIYRSRINTRIYDHVFKYDGNEYVETDEGSFESRGSVPCCGGDVYEDCRFNGQELDSEYELFELLEQACDGELTSRERKYTEEYSVELAILCHDEDQLTYGKYDNIYHDTMLGYELKPDHTIGFLYGDGHWTWSMAKYTDYDPETDAIINRYLINCNSGYTFVVEKNAIVHYGYMSISPTFILLNE